MRSVYLFIVQQTMSGLVSALDRSLFVVVPGDSALVKFVTDDANPSWNNGSGQTGFSFTYRSVICPSTQYVSTDTGLCQGNQSIAMLLHRDDDDLHSMLLYT
jgi:hypothetical protein